MAKGKGATTLCALLSAVSEVSRFIVSHPKAPLSQGKENVQPKKAYQWIDGMPPRSVIGGIVRCSHRIDERANGAALVDCSEHYGQIC